jgi:hypothetical protein
MSSKAKREIDAANLTPERLTADDIKAARRKAYSCGRHGLASSLKKYENPDNWDAVCCASRIAIVSQIASLYA